MKPQTHLSVESWRQAACFIVLSTLVTACSDSSDLENLDEATTVADSTNQSIDNNQSMADPLIQNSVPVNFDITVPYYLSDELSLELRWGDINITASWVGGQFWSATGEFPTQTTHPLEITFYDRFGAIELARHTQQYSVGSNAEAALIITAEQFDANHFDNDADGKNNLEELNAGTDPLIDEASLLEIADSYAMSTYHSAFSRLSVSSQFESRLPDDRPFVDTITIEPELNGQSQQVFGDFVFNFDANGNGTLNLNDIDGVGRFEPGLSATRTHTDDSISWTGRVVTSDSEYVHRESATNTVSAIDENLYQFVQESSGGNYGTYKFEWETSADLTGQLIEGTSLCQPVSGTVTLTQRSTYRTSAFETSINDYDITISKEIDDLYWRVTRVTNETDVVEYFARELQILFHPDKPDSAYFICDFVEFNTNETNAE